MSLNHGAVWWNELMTRDVMSALDYYRSVCGWSFDVTDMDDGSEYYVAIVHGKPVAGIMDMSSLPGMEGVPPHWFTYIAVDAVDTAVLQTRDAGGVILREPFHVPGVGVIAMIQDPTGAAVGLMTPEFPLDAQAGQEDELYSADGLEDDENYPV